jgi:beta-glucosidase
MKKKPPYLNAKLRIEERVDDLVSSMTLEEKISQMLHTAPAVERLGIPKYNWWNECLHGVARAGFATVFPQAIGLAATWNRKLIRGVATAISDEGRAKHHNAVKHGSREQYFGLTFWTPNINIFRDPRWGRGQETYGEDPYLTGEIGLQFVEGLQGNDPKYLKTVATPKHYAVHSGPEKIRSRFNAEVSRKDMEETYLPAFRKTVTQGKAGSVMGAYNRTNGEASCASKTLLQDILRRKWGFDGYVVSDCGAITNIYRDHKVVGTAEEAAALAVKMGCDLNCGDTYHSLRDAVKQSMITEAEINIAVKRLFTARFKLGMFDPPSACRYSSISMDVVGSRKHKRLALQAARESIVLLKNDRNILPLDRKSLKTIGLIGPNANEVLTLMGNYNGAASRPVMPLEGIIAKLPKNVRVVYEKGCDINRYIPEGIEQACQVAAQSDVVIVCLGLTPQFEGEEGFGIDPELSGDRGDVQLHPVQADLIERLSKLDKPLIAVLLNGSAIAMPSLKEKADAIIEAWYPGVEGGTAIADVIFGDYNPAGRLPVTFYASLDQLPPFDDYRMQGRTYRYFEGQPLYGFGFGLSYTKFKYSSLRLSARTIAPGDGLGLSVNVKNVGKRAGDEVVQVYVHPRNASVKTPILGLAQFQRVSIRSGTEKVVRLVLDPEAFSVVGEDGRRFVEPGLFDLYVGGGLPSAKELPGVKATLEILGSPVELPGAF